jgi:hypothetical protein
MVGAEQPHQLRTTVGVEARRPGEAARRLGLVMPSLSCRRMVVTNRGEDLAKGINWSNHFRRRGNEENEGGSPPREKYKPVVSDCWFKKKKDRKQGLKQFPVNAEFI